MDAFFHPLERRVFLSAAQIPSTIAADYTILTAADAALKDDPKTDLGDYKADVHTLKPEIAALGDAAVTSEIDQELRIGTQTLEELQSETSSYESAAGVDFRKTELALIDESNNPSSRNAAKVTQDETIDGKLESKLTTASDDVTKAPDEFTEATALLTQLVDETGASTQQKQQVITDFQNDVQALEQVLSAQQQQIQSASAAYDQFLTA